MGALAGLTHTHLLSLARALSLSRARALSLSHTHTRAHAHTHTHIHVRAHTHSLLYHFTVRVCTHSPPSQPSQHTHTIRPPERTTSRLRHLHKYTEHAISGALNTIDASAELPAVQGLSAGMVKGDERVGVWMGVGVGVL